MTNTVTCTAKVQLKRQVQFVRKASDSLEYRIRVFSSSAYGFKREKKARN